MTRTTDIGGINGWSKGPGLLTFSPGMRPGHLSIIHKQYFISPFDGFGDNRQVSSSFIGLT